MSLKDPFTRIEPFPPSWTDMGWTEKDFKWAVRQLELIPKKKLVEILKDEDIQISFTGENWEEETPKEQMASALVSDFYADKVIEVLKRHLSE